MKKTVMIIIAALLVVLAASGALIFLGQEKKGDINMQKNRRAIIETAKGNIEIELYEDKAPITTGNFIKLAQQGFYDGLAFHRVEPGFVIQAGDPYSRTPGDPRTGTGGPGYTIQDEFNTGIKHVKGTISMANTGQPNSAGSQFFITLDDTPFLDGGYAAFGRVASGMDVALSIAKGDVIKKITIS